MHNHYERKASLRLIIGIVLLPIVFSWFTLKTGYSKQIRVISFSWLIFFLVFAVIGETNVEQDGITTVNIAELPKNTELIEEKDRLEQHVEKQKSTIGEPVIDYGKINDSSQKMPVSSREKIDKSVYIPYNYNDNKQVFDIFGAQHANSMQPIRQKLAEQAISSGQCTKVNMSEVSIDSDINNPDYFVWCYTEGVGGKPGNEYQIYATESAIKSNAPLISKDDRGLSDSEATATCRRQIINNTREFSNIKVHYIADQIFLKNTDGSSIIKVGVTITNDLGVDLPHRATCKFNEAGNITYFDILRDS